MITRPYRSVKDQFMLVASRKEDSSNQRLHDHKALDSQYAKKQAHVEE
jgi:hypothetical protein